MYSTKILLYFLVFLFILVVCRTAPLYDRYNDDDDDDNRETNNQLKSLTSEELSELDEYLSYKLNEESTGVLDRNTRYPNQRHITKRDALWTTTEVLECVRRLKQSKNSSKLDLVTEMLNCYRRLKGARHHT
jgi:hypothetical protein